MLALASCKGGYGGVQVFLALKDVHRVVVHGDVNPSNIVWDPSGHFFQFVDLEFATWPGKVLVAPVATAIGGTSHPDHDTVAGDSHEFHSLELPTASESSVLSQQQMHTPSGSAAHMPPSPLSRPAHHTPPPPSPSNRLSQRWSPELNPEASPRKAAGMHTPKGGPRSHNDLSPSPRDPFPFVGSASGAQFPSQSRGGSSTPPGGSMGGGARPSALDIPRSPMRSAHSGRISFPGVTTPGGPSTPGARSTACGGDEKLRASAEGPPPPPAGCAPETIASVCT